MVLFSWPEVSTLQVMRRMRLNFLNFFFWQGTSFTVSSVLAGDNLQVNCRALDLAFDPVTSFPIVLFTNSVQGRFVTKKNVHIFKFEHSLNIFFLSFSEFI